MFELCGKIDKIQRCLSTSTWQKPCRQSHNAILVGVVKNIFLANRNWNMWRRKGQLSGAQGNIDYNPIRIVTKFVRQQKVSQKREKCLILLYFT